MTRKAILSCTCGLAWILVLAAIAVAGRPDAVGSLVGSRNAMLDGQAPLPHTVLLSGDKVAVSDGLAMVTLDRGNRMILGGDSEAVFLREAGMVTVRMDYGNLSLYHPPYGSKLRLQAGDVIVAPAGGLGALGKLSLAHGLLMVTTRNGSLRVEKGGATREVEKGQTLTVAATSGLTATAAGPGIPSANPGFSHGTAVATGVSSGGTALASMALTRSGRKVSPVTPGP